MRPLEDGMTNMERKKVGWIPLYGDFDVDDEQVTIRFKGRLAPFTAPGAPPGTEPTLSPQVGVLLSSQTLTDGDLSADIEFDQIVPESTCELTVAYDVDANHLVSAGLGAEPWALFAIREFRGPKNPQGWWNHKVSGDRVALKPGVSYHIEVRFRGELVTLSIDTVTVGAAEVTSPRGRPRQVGLLCRTADGGTVTIRRFTVATGKPKAFVVMHFGTECEDVYQDVIKEVCKGYEVNVSRADEVSGPGLIIGDIIREIRTSQLIIADITPTSNANVYFEIGYAMALDKPTILLAKRGTVLPFDVAGFRVLYYDDTIGGKRRLEEALQRHINEILATAASSNGTRSSLAR
jgi:hypothetical protein